MRIRTAKGSEKVPNLAFQRAVAKAAGRSRPLNARSCKFHRVRSTHARRDSARRVHWPRAGSGPGGKGFPNPDPSATTSSRPKAVRPRSAHQLANGLREDGGDWLRAARGRGSAPGGGPVVGGPRAPRAKGGEAPRDSDRTDPRTRGPGADGAFLVVRAAASRS